METEHKISVSVLGNPLFESSLVRAKSDWNVILEVSEIQNRFFFFFFFFLIISVSLCSVFIISPLTCAEQCAL